LCLILMFIKEERAKENAAHKGTLFKFSFSSFMILDKTVM